MDWEDILYRVITVGGMIILGVFTGILVVGLVSMLVGAAHTTDKDLKARCDSIGGTFGETACYVDGVEQFSK